MTLIKPQYEHGVPMISWKIYEDDYFDRHLVHEAVEKWAKEKPKEIAFVSVNTGQEFSWKEFDDHSTALALKLIDLGIMKGDFIATSLPFLPEHIFLEYACFKIGAIHVPLDVRLKPTEVVRCLTLVKAKMYFHLGETDVADFAAMTEIIRDNVDFVKYFVQFSKPDQLIEEFGEEKIISAWEFAKSAQDLFKKSQIAEMTELTAKYNQYHSNVQETDGCQVIYTTGSTGYPKPALLSHQGITAQNLCMGWGFDMHYEDLIMLVNLPPSHVGGQAEQLITTFFFGGKAIVLDLFKPDLSLEAIQKYKVTALGQIPALFNLEWRLPNYNTYNLSSLKFAIYGGQSVSRPFLEKLNLMSPKMGSGLGLTELSGMATYTPIDSSVDDVVEGIGYAMPITPITIRKKMEPDGTSGSELSKGEVGEICFSGPQVFLGYVNDEENTRKTISTDGWCYTGDVGFYDDKGLHFVGRAKLMIKPKGFNVYPPEVESFLMDNLKEQVETVGLIGYPHEVFGEGIIAFVEKRKGKSITIEEVETVSKGLAAYKRPSLIIILEYNDMPLNRSEKVDYVSLKNMANQKIREIRANGGWDQSRE
ncbi:class I adenylate-forming enzyme family protein [Candidatus Lokiarchaeum ossiferum]|uniref:class I adenylate-forming enzyme family protein n=1 Tax=Candidatus Lokiarchaeum ossiferum TaxID=2951803 RepID=UPI00352E37F0